MSEQVKKLQVQYNKLLQIFKIKQSYILTVVREKKASPYYSNFEKFMSRTVMQYFFEFCKNTAIAEDGLASAETLKAVAAIKKFCLSTGMSEQDAQADQAIVSITAPLMNLFKNISGLIFPLLNLLKDRAGLEANAEGLATKLEDAVQLCQGTLNGSASDPLVGMIRFLSAQPTKSATILQMANLFFKKVNG